MWLAVVSAATRSPATALFKVRDSVLEPAEAEQMKRACVALLHSLSYVCAWLAFRIDFDEAKAALERERERHGGSRWWEN